MKLEHEHGQGLVEYALILVLVGISVIVILQFLGPVVSAALAGDQTSIIWLVIGGGVIPLILGAAYYVLARFEKFSDSYQDEGKEKTTDKTEKGQGLAEFALIVLLAAIVIMAVSMWYEPIVTLLLSLPVTWGTVIGIILVGGLILVGLGVAINRLWNKIDKYPYE